MKLVNTGKDHVSLPWGQFEYSFAPGVPVEVFGGDVEAAIRERFPQVRPYVESVKQEAKPDKKSKEDKVDETAAI